MRGGQVLQGDHVICNSPTFLNKGEEVRIQEEHIRDLPKETVRVVDNAALIDHTTRRGSCQAIVGVEHRLIGMKVGGYWNTCISPDLVYRDKGVPGFIPADAALVVEGWLQAIYGRR